MSLTKVSYSMINGSVLNVLDYGASPSASASANTTAFQAAMNAAAAANGKIIFVPAGLYYLDGQLSLTTPIGVSFLGEGVDNTNLGGTRIIYTGTATPFFEYIGVNSRMFSIENIDFRYNNAGFTGTLLKLPGFDMKLRKVDLSGAGVANALYLLDINGSVDCILEQVRFGAAQYGLKGDGSNAVVLNQCAFSGPTVANIRNTGQGWTLNGCSMEPCANDLANGIITDSGNVPFGLNIIGCWFGDVIDTPSSPANQWITWHGKGLFVSGCYFNGAGYHSISAIVVDGLASGITITGNHFSAFLSVLNIGSNQASEVVMLGNNYNGNCDAFLTGTLLSGTSIVPEWVFAVPGPLIVTGGLTSASPLKLTSAATSGGVGTVTFGATTATTVGAAGGASALPASPLGYLISYVGTTQVKIPYYSV